LTFRVERATKLGRDLMWIAEEGQVVDWTNAESLMDAGTFKPPTCDEVLAA